MYNIIKILEEDWTDWTAASRAWTCGDQAAKENYSPVCLLLQASLPLHFGNVSHGPITTGYPSALSFFLSRSSRTSHGTEGHGFSGCSGAG